LDVQMPEMDGFEVMRVVGVESMPAVVFVTAHYQYAIQAFEISALDYLLKPVIEGRFVKALARAKKPPPHASGIRVIAPFLNGFQ